MANIFFTIYTKLDAMESLLEVKVSSMIITMRLEFCFKKSPYWQSATFRRTSRPATSADVGS